MEERAWRHYERYHARILAQSVTLRHTSRALVCLFRVVVVGMKRSPLDWRAFAVAAATSASPLPPQYIFASTIFLTMYVSDRGVAGSARGAVRPQRVRQRYAADRPARSYVSLCRSSISRCFGTLLLLARSDVRDSIDGGRDRERVGGRRRRRRRQERAVGAHLARRRSEADDAALHRSRARGERTPPESKSIVSLFVGDDRMHAQIPLLTSLGAKQLAADVAYVRANEDSVRSFVLDERRHSWGRRIERHDR